MGVGDLLVRDESERERMLEMDRIIAPRRRIVFLVLGLTLLLSAPWIGLWTLVPLAVAAIGFQIADRRSAGGGARPEVAMFAAWVLSEILIALSVMLSGGALTGTLGWLAIPIVTLSARFPVRGVVLGTAIAVGLTVLVAFSVSTAAVLADPTLVLAPVSTMICVAVLSTALLQSELRYRSEAVIDGLTGMLNRNGLEARHQELAQQSQLTGEPIGVVIGDLDHFKRVNDSLGHVVGDAVLRDVAYLMRKELRAFELAYRLGGEEFLILIPGADLESTRELAERLRSRIEADPVGGQRVTMSFGIGASQRGREFDFDRIFEQADAALYEAKRSGRNRVRDGYGFGEHAEARGGLEPLPQPAL
ncbi:GGDEF domain-containing protein [Thermoleophilia bacterium SCSIO 60948]|nr:GGDEF domain-containing protein [Thermoleophilia bacterium SCSIO 60948]